MDVCYQLHRYSIISENGFLFDFAIKFHIGIFVWSEFWADQRWNVCIEALMSFLLIIFVRLINTFLFGQRRSAFIYTGFRASVNLFEFFFKRIFTHISIMFSSPFSIFIPIQCRLSHFIRHSVIDLYVCNFHEICCENNVLFQFFDCRFSGRESGIYCDKCLIRPHKRN